MSLAAKAERHPLILILSLVEHPLHYATLYRPTEAAETSGRW